MYRNENYQINVKLENIGDLDVTGIKMVVRFELKNLPPVECKHKKRDNKTLLYFQFSDIINKEDFPALKRNECLYVMVKIEPSDIEFSQFATDKIVQYLPSDFNLGKLIRKTFDNESLIENFEHITKVIVTVLYIHNPELNIMKDEVIDQDVKVYDSLSILGVSIRDTKVLEDVAGTAAEDSYVFSSLEKECLIIMDFFCSNIDCGPFDVRIVESRTRREIMVSNIYESYVLLISMRI
jgi:hypothetical protein